jgi:sugar phosphate isomerase/epimerase
MSKPVSVQLYSVRDAISADRPGTLARIRGIGLTSVEPYAFANDPAGLRADLDAAGLTASSGHNSLIGVDSAEVVFEAAATVGIPVAIEPAVRDVWGDADAIKRVAEELNGLVATAASFGVKVGYHNHDWEFAALSSPGAGDGTAYSLFVRELSPEVVLEVDTYWATVGGQDAAALLRELGDRVGFIHVKDGSLEGDPVATQLPVGAGEVPVAGILQAAPQAVRVLEFDQYAGDLFDGLAEGLEFVTKADAQ